MGTSWYGGFLAKVSPRVRATILSHGTSLHYRAGELIFSEGDPSVNLYVVKSGHVELELLLPSKQHMSLVTLGPGDLFSWSALVEPRIETCFARAADDVEVLAVKSETLLGLCGNDPQLGLDLYRSLAETISARLTATRLQITGGFNFNTAKTSS
jgi:CRP/FNR family cyclic AMP-dependent transcriptional regulator